MGDDQPLVQISQKCFFDSIQEEIRVKTLVNTCKAIERPTHIAWNWYTTSWSMKQRQTLDSGRIALWMYVSFRSMVNMMSSFLTETRMDTIVSILNSTQLRKAFRGERLMTGPFPQWSKLKTASSKSSKNNSWWCPGYFGHKLVNFLP